jgi:lipoprotein-anchoring transpeptidase ErfK/SrfK
VLLPERPNASTGWVHAQDVTVTQDPNHIKVSLSAHEVLTQFDGGDAEVGIYGNNDASVLGTSVTHGCVRIDNAEITALSKVLPLGTPVVITG